MRSEVQEVRDFQYLRCLGDEILIPAPPASSVGFLPSVFYRRGAADTDIACVHGLGRCVIFSICAVREMRY